MKQQLEQTVTKLQTVLALSPDQVAALPPPLVRIRELEQENEVLHREIEDLRRQLEQRNANLRPDISRRSDIPTPSDDRRCDREAKRRRTAEANNNIYIVRPSYLTRQCSSDYRLDVRLRLQVSLILTILTVLRHLF